MSVVRRRAATVVLRCYCAAALTAHQTNTRLR